MDKAQLVELADVCFRVCKYRVFEEDGMISCGAKQCPLRVISKLPEGKPSLLSDEGIYDADMSAVTAYIKEHSGKDSWDGSECEMSGRRAIAQAQWDICVKWYGGKE